MSFGLVSVESQDLLTSAPSNHASREISSSASADFVMVLEVLASLRQVCEEIILNCASFETSTAQTKNQHLIQQLEELQSASEKAAKAEKGSLVGRIFGYISLVVSALLVCLCPTPMTIAGFCVCLAMTVDSEVATHVENYDGMMGELSQELMEAMDGINPALAAAITALVIVAIVVAVTVISAKGLGNIFPKMTGAPPGVLLDIIGPDKIQSLNASVDGVKIISQCADMALQVFSSVSNFQAAGFILSSEDLEAIVAYIETSLTLFAEISQQFDSIVKRLIQLFNNYQ